MCFVFLRAEARLRSSCVLSHPSNLYKVTKAGVCCFLCAAPGLQHHWHFASWLRILEPLTSWMWSGTSELFVFLMLVTDIVTEERFLLPPSSLCSWKCSINRSTPSWGQAFQKPTWQSGLVSQSRQGQMLVWTSGENERQGVSNGRITFRATVSLLVIQVLRHLDKELVTQCICHYHCCSLSCLFSDKWGL